MVTSALIGELSALDAETARKGSAGRRNCHFQVYDMWLAMQVLQSMSANFPAFVKIVAVRAK
jgi:hypothetical protein